MGGKRRKNQFEGIKVKSVWILTSLLIGFYSISIEAKVKESVKMFDVHFCSDEMVKKVEGKKNPQDYFFSPVQSFFCNGSTEVWGGTDICSALQCVEVSSNEAFQNCFSGKLINTIPQNKQGLVKTYHFFCNEGGTDKATLWD